MKFIPGNKHDLEACAVLQETSCVVIRPEIRSLLVWLQDVNWPVAQPVMSVLKEQGQDLVEPILEVLRSHDEVWKFNLIAHFLPLLEYNLINEFEPEIFRIATSPTETEAFEEINVVAIELIEELKAMHNKA